MPTSEQEATLNQTTAIPWFSLHWAMFALGFFDLVKKNIIFVFFLAFQSPGWLIPYVGFGLAASLAYQLFS